MTKSGPIAPRGGKKKQAGVPQFRDADFAARHAEPSKTAPPNGTLPTGQQPKQLPSGQNQPGGYKFPSGQQQSGQKRQKQSGGTLPTGQQQSGGGDNTAAAHRAETPLPAARPGTAPPLPGKAAGGAYTLAVFLMLLVSFLLALAATVISGGDRQAYQDIVSKNAFRLLSYALPQLAFFLTAFAALRLAKIKKAQAFPREKPPVYLWAAAILLAFGLLFGLGNVNELFLSFLKKFGYETPQSTLPAMRNAGEYLLTVFCVAVLPAVMEEALFRGVILGGLRGKSTLFAVLVSGLYFSLFHQNPAQTPYQFLAGAAFAFAAIASNNLLITILAHFCNNFYILSAEYFGFSAGAHRVWTVFGLLALAFSLALFFLAGKKRGAFRSHKNLLKTEKIPAAAGKKSSLRKTSSLSIDAAGETRPEIKDFFVFSLPGAIASAVAWVLVLVS